MGALAGRPEKQQSMSRRTPILLRIIDSFFRHQALFWSALLIVSGLTMTALYARSKTFHASAMTQVQTESVAKVLGAGETETWIPPAQKSVDKFTDLVKQNQPGGFLDLALKRAALVKPISADPQADDPRYGLLQKNLTASMESPNQFAINLTWDNQDECKNIVDAVQKQYISEVGDDRAIVSTSSVTFLDSEITGVEQKMRRAEKALADFKSSNGGQLSDAQSAYNNQLSSLQAQLTDKQVTLGENGRKKEALQQQLAQMQPMSIAEQTVSDQSPVEKEVASLLAQRDSLMTGPGAKTPQHPDIVALDERISALQAQQRSNAKAPENQHNTQTKLQENPGYQALKQQVTEAAIAQEADQQQIQNLSQQIGKYQALVNKIPAAQRQLADKTRDYRNLQDQYDSLQKKRNDVQEQASLDRLSASSSLSPIGVTFAQPTTGKTKLIALLLGSLLLGTIVGTLLIVLSEWSDHSLRYEADAERLLGVPVLAALPESTGLLSGSRPALTGAGSAALPAPERT